MLVVYSIHALHMLYVVHTMRVSSERSEYCDPLFVVCVLHERNRHYGWCSGFESSCLVLTGALE